MKKVYYFFLILCLFSVNVFGQIIFQKTFRGSVQSADAFCVQQTSDGGYILTGDLYAAATGTRDYGLIKTNATGDTMWTKSFGRYGTEGGGRSIRQTSDGGYVISGKYDGNHGDVWLIKTDSIGIILWNKTYGSTALTEEGLSVQKTSDGGYIVMGNSSNISDMYLIKTNAVGDTLWTKSYGSTVATTVENCRGVQQTSDGGYIMAGYTNGFGAGSYDIFIVKTDAVGNISWAKTYGGTGSDNGYSVQQTSEGGYIIAATVDTVGIYLIKTNSTGDTLWTRSLGGRYPSVVQQTSDGGYIMVGDGNGMGQLDVYLVKTDATGSVSWAKCYGGTYYEHGYYVQQTSDGGYIVSGTNASFSSGSFEAYFIKTDANGNSGCDEINSPIVQRSSTIIVANQTLAIRPYTTTVGTVVPIVGSGFITRARCALDGINEIENISPISIYPNPSSGSFKIEKSTLINSRLEIFNSLGEKIYSALLKDENIELNATPGVYFVKVSDGERVYTQKLVIE